MQLGYLTHVAGDDPATGRPRQATAMPATVSSSASGATSMLIAARYDRWHPAAALRMIVASGRHGGRRDLRGRA